MEMLPPVEEFQWLTQNQTPTERKSKAKWLKHRELAWDSTHRKYTPLTLKGFRPITFEPWSDDSIRFKEERSVGFDPWGTGEVWDRQKGTPDVQGKMLNYELDYHDWLQRRRRIKNVLQAYDEYRTVRR